MPEIPEVEALCAALRDRAGGTRVARIDLAAISALKTFDPPITAIEGRHLADVSRHGKYLDFMLVDDDGEPIHLLLHLSRAGWITWRDSIPALPPKPGRGPLAVRISFVTDDGEPIGGFDVTEAGTQKRLTLHVVRDPMDVERVATLGPDPLDPAFTADTLGAILTAAGRSQIKGVLKDQRTIAGIGNAYSDEILHLGRISPFAAANGVDPVVLLGAIRDTLGKAIEVAMATDPTKLKAEKKSSMRVHGQTGKPCPECGDTVREVAFADSSLQYCPTCQTGGKPLADRRMSRLLK